MDEGKGYNIKQNKPVRERQMPYHFTHMWNKTKERKKKEDKPKYKFL